MKKLFSLLLIVTVFNLIQVNAQLKKLNIEDFYSNTQFSAKQLPEIRSMNDGKHYTELISESGLQKIVKKEYSSDNIVSVLFETTDLKVAKVINDYQLNNDETKILLITDQEKIYRHSTKANHLVFEIKSKKSVEVSKIGKQQNASFSPNNNLIAFVRENNIYIMDLGSNSEKQLTTDGKKNEIINGIPDWVYEEEFSFKDGFHWSSDGKYIAYYRFDESKVKEFNLTFYGSVYPEERKYKYPKAGETNSHVEIHIVDVATGIKVKADVNKEADQYIPRIKWSGQVNKLCVTRLNRLQNKLDLYLCDAATGETNLFFTETNKAYIEITDDLRFLSDNKGFIHTSTMDGYNHIYLYNIDGTLNKQITSGKWDVTEFYGYDESAKYYYFQAALNNPMEKGIYKIKSGKKIAVVNDTKGTNTASFSSNFNYYFINNSRLNKPYNIKLYSKNGSYIRTVIDNNEVLNAMSKYELTKPEFFQFNTSENINLNGWMIKPADFDSSRKYPVLQYMYGGPNSQTVKDVWTGPNFFWFQMLAQQGYIVVSVDNRGTGARGEEFNKCVYKQLGHLETIDQIEVAKWLGKQSYVDASRIGAWGWSYGGYMASLLMTKGADYFKAAIAVAPVTNWKYYDTIYTERYLQSPEVNPAGYEDNSPINFTNLLKGKFLLIHGTADDNVHFQNSTEFVNALIADNKQFESFYYPDKAHSISGVRAHLFSKMTDFILENL